MTEDDDEQAVNISNRQHLSANTAHVSINAGWPANTTTEYSSSSSATTSGSSFFSQVSHPGRSKRVALRSEWKAA